LEPLLFAPKSAPKLPLPLVPGLEPSCSDALAFGEVDRLVGANASRSLPTGDMPRLTCPTSMVAAWVGVGAPPDEAESTRVASVVADESTVSEAISGEDSVR
jgi:hypothetical protein